MRIVCDIDGVLTIRKDIQLHDDEFYRNLKPTPAVEIIKKIKVTAFLTGRFERHRKTTKNWLKKHGIKNKVIMYPDNLPKTHCSDRRVIEFKAKQLQRLKADVYIEDNEEVASKLSELCPRTTIILLKVIS